LKLVSFNVNGIRARLHQLQTLVEKHDPDIIGLQEIKVHDDAFPRKKIAALGYEVVHHGQKGHYGVAILTKQVPEVVVKGFPGEPEDAQRRTLIATWQTARGPLTVINGYFPQGESRDHPTKFPNKTDYYARLTTYLAQQREPDEALVVMGDFNIAPTDRDIGIGEPNAKRWLRTGKCSFLPEEREWMAGLLDWGLTDSFRHLNPEVDDRFSWFDYRSRAFEADPKRGLRIDLILLTDPLLTRCRESGIDYDMRGMEKPSDHAPVWTTLEG